MAEITKTALFAKLTAPAYKALEAGVVSCKTRGNPQVEIAHWIDQLLRKSDLDLPCVVRAFQLQPERLALDTTNAVDILPTGAATVSAFSPRIFALLEQAFLWSAIYFDSQRIRSGHLLLALLKSDQLRPVLLSISAEFKKIDPDKFAEEFTKILSSTAESNQSGPAPVSGTVPGEASGAIPAAEMGRQEALKRFTTDLTEKARKGEIDPIVGRDEEIRQCVDILMRRRQNNPILTGEAGVGKTAVVEGFALRIVSGDVPPALRDVTLRALDVGLLQAGASMKGEFEQRLRSVIDEVQASPRPIILFIDEVHTLIGAGGAAGTGDAANLLKPALARGTLRTLAATTWDEYKRHIEKDPALTRRFQVVKVEEPSEEKCVLMVRAAAGHFEKHHRAQLLDEAIDAAVRLSNRYITGRQLPDKAFSLIDTASARVAVSHHAVPPELDDCRRRIEALEIERGLLNRETDIGMDHLVRVSETQTRLASEKEKLAILEKDWASEKELVQKILELRGKLRRETGQPIDPDKAKASASAVKTDEKTAQPLRDAWLKELRELETSLKERQGDSPLIFPSVDAGAIAKVVADWTGIPVGRMVKDELRQVLQLADIIERRVIGQRHALEMIARRVQTNRARLDNPNRPIGVFMLAGPSGTGKTETALALAEALYGGEQNMISINMSEFQEAHTVSTLKGSPPGYVGYGEGGVLTEAVRRRPYSVVLLDEVEKAHHDVHEIFFQVFDKGWMEDAEGRYIDFKNTIIILTTNAAQNVIINLCKDPELVPTAEGLEKALRGPLTKAFPDALLNRLVVVPYYPISQEMLQRIIEHNLRRVQKRVLENHKVPFTYDQSVLELIGQRCSELERGARMVDAMITNTILPEVGREVLTRLTDGRGIKKVHVGAKEGNFEFNFD